MGEVHSYLAGMLAPPAAPVSLHSSSRVVVHVHRACAAAELNPGTIRFQHADGCHSFEVEGHEVIVGPRGERAALLAELKQLRDQLRATRIAA